MARESTVVTLTARWWVKPYMEAVAILLWAGAPFLDDQRRKGFIEAAARFVATRGFIVR